MSRDLVDRLRELPPELPDVPDRVRRVRHLARRRRRAQLAAVAATTVIAVAVPVAVVRTLSVGQPTPPRPSRPATVPADVARSCSTAGFEIRSLPRSGDVTHTSAQALASLPAGATNAEVFPAVVRSPITPKLGLGPAGAARTTWVIYQITTVARPQQQPGSLGGPFSPLLVGTRIAGVRFVDDATLKLAGAVSCAPVSATAGDVGFGIPDGTRVAATGLIAPAGAGYVLCLAGGTLDTGFGGPTCADQIALVGDANALGHRSRQSRDISGTWHHNTLEVASIGAPRNDFEPMLTTPPCPTPAGGWAHVAPSKTPNLDSSAFEHYRSTHPGVVTAIAMFRPSNLTPILTIASTGPAATRSALRNDYPRALCVVRSRYSASQVRTAQNDVQRAFTAHQLPGVYGFGPSVSAQGQPTEELQALSDRPELHQALSRVPAGMLVILPWIRQLG